MMKLGVMANGIAALGLTKALAFAQKLGLSAIEIPVGLYAKNRLIDPSEMLDNPARQKALHEHLDRHGLELSALGCSGNPVHPDSGAAKAFESAHDIAVRLASQLCVGVVNCFSGCPGGSASDRTPNWITCPWPNEFEHMLQYQWEEVLLPFWRRKAGEAANLGVKLALEMHPGMSIFNPESLLRLRDHAGPALGCNFDPSHLFWQGIDPLEAARIIGGGGGIFHVHAKDVEVHPHRTRIHGVIDPKSYGRVLERAWVFRTVGYGHGDEFWKPFVSMLRKVGYDGILSIEHEDSLMGWEEGFVKAANYLKTVLIAAPAGQAWWF